MEGERGWWGLSWWVWALACVAIAVVYAVVVTEHPGASPAWRAWILRWAHSLCWVLLAVHFVLRLTPWAGLAGGVAVAGGLTYALFLMTKFTTPGAT